MLRFVVGRVLVMIPTLAVISVVAFWIINLPPGDYVDHYVASLAARGEFIDAQTKAQLQQIYGLDQPLIVQYWKWITRALGGDFGSSYEWQRPVAELIWERLPRTLALSLSCVAIVYLVSIPFGVFSALHQRSFLDYLLNFFGFLGLSVPNFTAALILLYIGFEYFGQSVGGFFSPGFQDAAWSAEKFSDFLSHIWVAVLVICMSGTAGLIRITRANLLDELGKQYVVAARARGMARRKLVWKYPVRIAMNPVISSFAFVLPWLISGSEVTAIVLNLPTSGPIYLKAVQAQDNYLSGAFILLFSIVAVIGTLVSDILLAWADPRIRFQSQN